MCNGNKLKVIFDVTLYVDLHIQPELTIITGDNDANEAHSLKGVCAPMSDLSIQQRNHGALYLQCHRDRRRLRGNKVHPRQPQLYIAIMALVLTCCSTASK